MTVVKFIKERETSRILAVFPKLIWVGLSPVTVTCYSHEEKHSACQMNWVKKQLPASDDEYKDLLSELTKEGYDDIVIEINDMYII